MTLALINRLSDWNSQLFHELKGQFQPRNLATTIAASLIFQGTLVLFFYILLPAKKTNTALIRFVMLLALEKLVADASSTGKNGGYRYS